MAKLIVIQGPLKDQVFDLGNSDTVFCGRYPRMNDISILDITVSRKHFKIFRIGKNVFVEDLKSKHGTMVNGRLIEAGEGYQVNEGDIITAGNTAMRLAEVSARRTVTGDGSKPQEIKIETDSKESPKEERRSAKELEFVYKVSELFKEQMNHVKFLEEVLKLLLEALPRIDNARFFLFGNGKMKTVEIAADSHEKSTASYSRKVLDKVIKERKTVRMSNTDFESPSDYADSRETLEIKSILCVPITRSDEILGAVYIDSISPYGFRKEDQRLLNSLTGPMALAIERDRLVSDSEPERSIHWKDKLSNLIKAIRFKK